MTLWLFFIIIHAAAAVTNFTVGLTILSPKRVKQHKELMYLFLASLAVVILCMIGAVVSRWNDDSILERVVFSCLIGLALYMMYRALHAQKLLQHLGPDTTYIDDVGFILISLFNGFTVVALIDLKVPGWAVGVGVVVATLLGAKLLALQKRKLTH